MEIQNVFKEAENINVYNDGVKVTYSAGGEDYKKILDCWNNAIEGSHQMPAFGVSLDRQTKEALNSGLWVEFCFAHQMQRSDMPFEKLLVNVNKGTYGFNIIRYTSKCGYDGRCYYLDLVGKNLDGFYDLLLNL